MKKIEISIIVAFFLVFFSCTTRPVSIDEKDYLLSFYNNSLLIDEIEIVIGEDDEAKRILEEESAKIITDMKLSQDEIDSIRSLGNYSAVTISNKIYFFDDNYKSCFLAGYPEIINDPYSISLFSHEVFHVWQWQNSKLTGYSLTRLVKEHLFIDFPYIYNPYELVNEQPKKLLEYNFEQQAQMVQDLVYIYLFKKAGYPDYLLDNKLYETLLQKFLEAGFIVDDFISDVNSLYKAVQPYSFK